MGCVIVCGIATSMYDGDIDEAYDEPRQSLLDLVQQRMAEIGKTVMISRLVYVARPVDLHSNTKEIADFHEILIDEAVGDSSEKCTGLLLCYPNVSLHVIEAPTNDYPPGQLSCEGALTVAASLLLFAVGFTPAFRWRIANVADRARRKLGLKGGVEER